MAKISLLVIIICIFSIGIVQASSPWLGSDKPMHLIGSAYLVYWNYHLASEVFEYSHQNSLMFSVSLTSFLGTGKELSDKYIKKTRFSWHDMAYNAAGIAIGVLIIEVSK